MDAQTLAWSLIGKRVRVYELADPQRTGAGSGSVVIVEEDGCTDSRLVSDRKACESL